MYAGYRYIKPLTRLKSLVDFVCRGVVAFITDERKLGLHHTYQRLEFSPGCDSGSYYTWLNFGDTNGSVDKLLHERARKCTNSMFCRTVDAAPNISFPASDRTKINNMSSLPLLEFYEAE